MNPAAKILRASSSSVGITNKIINHEAPQPDHRRWMDLRYHWTHPSSPQGLPSTVFWVSQGRCSSQEGNQVPRVPKWCLAAWAEEWQQGEQALQEAEKVEWGGMEALGVAGEKGEEGEGKEDEVAMVE